LIEPRTGVFLGNPSARVRDELWKLASAKLGDGSAVQIWSERGPQGFRYRSQGDNDRELVDLEGIALVRRKPRAPRAMLPQPKGTNAQATDLPESEQDDDLLF
jgi:CRISPR-associated protein Cas2